MRFLAFLFCLFLSTQAFAQKRIALVIGNSDYKHTPKLANPANDAQDIESALKRLGFETISGLDLTKSAIDDLLIRFSREVRTADVALVYFAGHGIQFGGVNYLVPTDAILQDEVDLRRLVRVDEIMSDLQNARSLRVLILDACRDNPLADEFRRRLDRSRASFVQSGLAKIDSPIGTVIAYATQAGRVAEDGTGRNSPFTRGILARISDPTEIGVTFRRIASDVYEQTSKRQLPELSISLVDEYYLSPNGTPKSGALARPRPQTSRAEGANIGMPYKGTKSILSLSSSDLATIRPGETFQECADCPEMIVLPPGEFIMGASPEEKNPPKYKLPIHQVNIPAKFAVARFEVTALQFAAFLSAVSNATLRETYVASKSAEPEVPYNLRISSGGARYVVDSGFEQHPASYVTFIGANAYVEWLRRTTGKPYRLLSESEWEYAARATTKTEFYYGTDEDWKRHCEYANISDLDRRMKYPKYRAALCNDGYADLAPVGKFKPNLFGLYDMYGNVMEWVTDCWHDDYNEAPIDGSAWTRGADCNARVVRGGSINHLFYGSSDRGYAWYNSDKIYSGIRVARDLQ